MKAAAVKTTAGWSLDTEDMGKTQLPKVTCTNCRESLDPSWAHLSPRPPCPACGKRGVAIAIGIAEEIDVAESLNVGLHPHDTDRNWRRRWTELESEWSTLAQPITEPMSGVAINAANHRLQSFYIQAYHLKDALKSVAPAIEEVISATSALSLLADLANLDKHAHLDRGSRSGGVPMIVSVSGEQSGSGGGWRLRLRIQHKGEVLDGMAVARAAMDAWRTYLTSSGLL